MAEAARQVVDWVGPDFIDAGFGCPVNKVVAKNGGSALLKDCPALAGIAEAVVRAVAPLHSQNPHRLDANSINAKRVAQLLEELGIAALAVHGPTRAQRYSGAAHWETIGEVANSVSIPVIGNGDIAERARRRSAARENKHRRSDDWPRRHECATDFSPDQRFPDDGHRAASPALSKKWDIIQQPAASPLRNGAPKIRRCAPCARG